MNRRDFISGSATGLVIGAGVVLATKSNAPDPGTPSAPGKAPAVIGQAHEWKMVTCWPKNFPGVGTGAQHLADLIGSMSGGRLQIKLFAAGELVPAFEVFDAVREGTAECGHSVAYYWIAKNKSLAFFGAVPSGLTELEHLSWLKHGGGQELWDEIYNDFGLRAFPAGSTGVQMGGWFKKEINSLSDFKGLKYRIPGLAAEVINRMGATAVNTPGGEIMPALQSGVIDAAEWVGPWNDLTFGFHKVAKHYYGPGFQEGGGSSEFMLNLDAWNKLPKDLQDIVYAASTTIHNELRAEYFAKNAGSLPVLLQEHGVQLHSFPNDVTLAMHRLANDVVAETASEGEINRRVYESWNKFRNTAMQYQPLDDYGFVGDRAAARNT